MKPLFLLRALFFLFATALLMICALFAWMQTEGGKGVVQQWLIKQVELKGPALYIGSIKGRLPFKWKASNVVLTAPNGAQLTMEKVKVRVALLPLFRGTVLLKSLKIFHAYVELPKRAPLPPFSLTGKAKWWPRKQKGSASVRAALDADSATQLVCTAQMSDLKLIEGFLELNLSTTKWLEPYVELPVHGKASLRTAFKGPLNDIALSDLHLDTPLFSLQGEGALSRQSAHTTFEVHYPFPMHGALDCDGSALRMHVNADPFDLNEERFTGGRLSLEAKRVQSAWEGALEANLESERLPIRLLADLAIDHFRTFALKEIYVLAPETELGGTLVLDAKSWTVQGALFAQCKNGALFNKVLPGYQLKGRCGLEARFEATPQQIASARLIVEEGQVRKIRADRFEIQIQASDFSTIPKGKLEIDAEGVQTEELVLERLSLQASHQEESIPFSIEASGSWEERLKIALKGSLLPSMNGWDLFLESFQGEAINRSFELKNPVKVSRTPKSLEISDVDLNYSGGKLQGKLNFDEKSAELKVLSEHFPLELFSKSIPTFTLKGSCALDVHLQSFENQLKGYCNLLLERVRLSEYGKQAPLMGKGSLQIHFDKNKAQIHAHCLSSGHQFFVASATLPYLFQHDPLSLSPDPNRPFSAQLFLDGRLEEIFDFLNLKGQRIRGHVLGELTFSHTFASPKIAGTIRLNDGTYDNMVLGTALQEIHVEIAAREDGLVLQNFSAQGAGGGTLTAQGRMEFNPKQSFPYHFETQAHHIQAVDFDSFSAKISGPLAFDGSLKELLIHGKVRASSAEITIPDTLPYEIPIYPVQWINPPPHLKKREKSTTDAPVRYDIKVKAPEHVSVHGRGLSSEWKGTAHIKGEDAHFTGKGALSLVRGEFEFSGKRFSLTKGEITFSESGAQIDLRGTLQVSDATILAILTGPLHAPSLTFQSMPAMPTSSILARLIFNKDMSEITPFQAITLANAIVTLSGETGPNLLEKIRSSLGVDRFTIVSGGATGDQIAVQIGKYLTQGVMLTLSQSAHSSQAMVEVELKAGFILQAETQEEEEGKFSLKWNHNY